MTVDRAARGTESVHLGQSVTVATLAIEVLEGPDAPARHDATSDRVSIGSAPGNDLALSDPTVSRFHLELHSGGDGIDVADLASKNGTWIGGAAVERARIVPGTELRIGRTLLKVVDGAKRSIESHLAPTLRGLMGATPAMRRLMAMIQRVASSGVAVLVTGESGTGKEVIARALHDEGDRASKPFVVVDCGSLTPTLVASALFGHERGAFTGADRRREGAFERAHGGTVFLDEIGELGLELQPQLLGVLERKRFTRLGGETEIGVDVRVIAATNRDLRSEVNRGTFREDLYYRISVVNLRVPPLRERLDDLSMLAEHFLAEAGSAHAFEEIFTAAVLDQMRRHHWPGNVRELRNYVEALVAVGEAPHWLDAGAAEGPGVTVGDEVLLLRYAEARERVLCAFERAYLGGALARAGGNVSRAARETGMNRSYLIKLLAKHDLK